MKNFARILAFILFSPIWIVVYILIGVASILASAVVFIQSLFEFSLSGKWNYTTQRFW